MKYAGAGALNPDHFELTLTEDQDGEPTYNYNDGMNQTLTAVDFDKIQIIENPALNIKNRKPLASYLNIAQILYPEDFRKETQIGASEILLENDQERNFKKEGRKIKDKFISIKIPDADGTHKVEHIKISTVSKKPPTYTFTFGSETITFKTPFDLQKKN